MSLYSTWAPSFGPRVPSSCCKKWGVGGICFFLVPPPPLPTRVSVPCFERFQNLSSRGISPVPESVSRSRPWELGRHLRRDALTPGEARRGVLVVRGTCEGSGHSWQRPRQSTWRVLPRHGLICLSSRAERGAPFGSTGSSQAARDSVPRRRRLFSVRGSSSQPVPLGSVNASQQTHDIETRECRCR